MNPAPDQSDGGHSSWLRREAVLDRFEKTWQEAGDARVEDFLPPLGSAQRTVLLQELIKIDLEFRWSKGQRLQVEDYVRRLPELAEAGEPPTELILEEIRVRQFHGCPPSQTELQERFPRHASLWAGEPSSDATEPATGPTPPLSSCPTVRVEPGAFAANPSGDSTVLAPGAPFRRLGRYELHEQLGRGGFATVYRGWDPELRRPVAVKVPHPSLLADPDLRARVLRESSSAARLRHPAIVPIHETGRDGDVAFIIYEFIPGPTLTQVLSQTSPAPQQAAQWVARLAEALDYAHGQGIIHRDVKPANVLMDRDGQPLLADFGLAQQTEASALLTREGDVLGTPAYMAPEQAAGHSHAADRRCDVYSLGVLLYEMLTGQRPFDAAGAGILHQVLHEEPAPPRKHRPAVPADLETICLKAMSKEPRRRYATAGEMADDLHRYLEHRPIRARRIGPVGRVARWCRRKPALAATMVVAAVIGLVGFWQVWQERNRFRAEREQALANLYQSRVEEARALRHARANGYRTDVWRLLQDALHLDTPERNPAALRQEAVACLGDFVGLPPRTWRDYTKTALVVAVARHPKEPQVALGLLDGSIELRELPSGAVVSRWQGHRSGVFAVAFAPDGKTLATGDDQGILHAWSLQVGKTWTCNGTFQTDPCPKPHKLGAVSLAVTPDGKELVGATKHCGTIRRWALMEGKETETIRAPDQAQITCVGISRDGRYLAAGYSRDQHSGVLVWERSSGRPPHDLTPGLGGVQQVCFGEGGKLLACACADGAVLFETQHWGTHLFVRGDELYGIALSSDERTLAIPSYSLGVVRIWDVTINRQEAALRYPGEPHAVCFSTDGASLVAADAQSVSVWNLRGTGEKLTLPGHEPAVNDVAFRPDGRCLASAGADGIVKLWDSFTGELLGSLPRVDTSVRSISFHPSGGLLVTAQGSKARVYDVTSLATPKELAALPSEGDAPMENVAFSPDGKLLATATTKGLTLWQVPPVPGHNLPSSLSWQVVGRPAVDRFPANLQFSPDSKMLGWVEATCVVHLWDIARAEDTVFSGAVGGSPLGLAFTPDSKQVLMIPRSRIAEVWDVSTRKKVSDLVHTDPEEHGNFYLGRSLALTQDGTRLVILNQVVTIRDARTGELLLALPKERSMPRYLAWSPDGQLLAIGSADGGIAIWRLPAIRARLAEIGLDW